MERFTRNGIEERAMEQTKKRQKSKTANKVLSVIGIVLCIVFIPIIIVNTTLMIKKFIRKDEIPSIFGVFPMIVVTDSMKGEFEAGDLLVCKKINADQVNVGDVICFYDPLSKNNAVVTHRVVEIKTDDDGKSIWITKGDANNTEDISGVPQDNLVGRYSFRLKGLGSVALFIQSTTGRIVCIVVPLALLLIYEVTRRRIVEKNMRKEKEELQKELAREKRKKVVGGGSRIENK